MQKKSINSTSYNPRKIGRYLFGKKSVIPKPTKTSLNDAMEKLLSSENPIARYKLNSLDLTNAYQASQN